MKNRRIKKLEIRGWVNMREQMLVEKINELIKKLNEKE